MSTHDIELPQGYAERPFDYSGDLYIEGQVRAIVDANTEALRAEVERLTLEMRRLQQQYDERTACMIVHRGQALACSDAVRTAYSDAIAQQSAAVDGLAPRLVDELDGLVSESDGVSGLHLNGDVATWEELLPGGRFERLSSLDELREALAAQRDFQENQYLTS